MKNTHRFLVKVNELATKKLSLAVFVCVCEKFPSSISSTISDMTATFLTQGLKYIIKSVFKNQNRMSAIFLCVCVYIRIWIEFIYVMKRSVYPLKMILVSIHILQQYIQNTIHTKFFQHIEKCWSILGMNV